jgi:hypothetical protein
MLYHFGKKKSHWQTLHNKKADCYADLHMLLENVAQVFSQRIHSKIMLLVH